MEIKTGAIVALSLTTAFLAYKLMKSKTEIKRLNGVLLPIAKKVDGATASIKDLSPGTVIAE